MTSAKIPLLVLVSLVIVLVNHGCQTRGSTRKVTVTSHFTPNNAVKSRQWKMLFTTFLRTTVFYGDRHLPRLQFNYKKRMLLQQQLVNLSCQIFQFVLNFVVACLSAGRIRFRLLFSTGINQNVFKGRETNSREMLIMRKFSILPQAWFILDSPGALSIRPKNPEIQTEMFGPMESTPEFDSVVLL